MLRVEGLSAGYRAGVPVVHDFELRLSPGEVVGVVGRNGAGKTCIAGALIGTLPIGEGRIVLDDEDITRARPARRVAAGLSLAPEGRQVFAALTVRENLVVAAYGAGRRLTAELIDRAESYFPVLRDKAQLRAGSLSGGEQQWLAIARTLVQEPKVMVLDEPSLGLSPIAVQALGAALADIRDREAPGMLLMEQNPELLRRLCLSVLVLDQGSVRATISREELTNDALAEVFLGAARR